MLKYKNVFIMVDRCILNISIYLNIFESILVYLNIFECMLYILIVYSWYILMYL
jgi:hypothetical protein